jgi:hypothetical protein
MTRLNPYETPVCAVCYAPIDEQDNGYCEEHQPEEDADAMTIYEKTRAFLEKADVLLADYDENRSQEAELREYLEDAMSLLSGLTETEAGCMYDHDHTKGGCEHHN